MRSLESRRLACVGCVGSSNFFAHEVVTNAWRFAGETPALQASQRSPFLLVAGETPALFAEQSAYGGCQAA